MFTKLRSTLTTYIADLLKDDSGRYGLAKSILSCGFVIATLVIVYLTVSNQLTTEYFGIYVGLISGHHLASKWLDKDNDTNP
jgi:hypothetical protein